MAWTWLALVTSGIVIGALVVVAIVRWRQRGLPSWPVPLAPERRKLLSGRLRRLLGLMPARPLMTADELPSLPATATVEAALLSNDTRTALAAAEAAVAQTPEDARAYVLLARALFATDALTPAHQVIERARALGADLPLLDHLEGRVDQLLWLRRVNPGRPEVQRALIPPLSTPFDRFLVDLARRQREGGGGPLWLHGGETSQKEAAPLSPEALGELIREHGARNVRSLELLLTAAERAPGAAEFTYHVARRALQCGFVAEGKALMDRLVPLADGLPDRDAFARDRAELDGQPPAFSKPGDPPTARRSPSLRLLK
jgi:hypothetical protein